MGLFDNFRPDLGWLANALQQAQGPSFGNPAGDFVPGASPSLNTTGHANIGAIINNALEKVLPPLNGGQQPGIGQILGTPANASPYAQQQPMPDPNMGVPTLQPQAPSRAGLDERAYGTPQTGNPLLPPQTIGGLPPEASNAMAQAPQQQSSGFPNPLSFVGKALGGIGDVLNPTRAHLQDAGTDVFGNKQFVWVDPVNKTITPASIGGGQPGSGSSATGLGMLAPGVSQVNSSLGGDEYVKQFSPEVQAAVKAYKTGDVMPSGNPRTAGIASLAKTIAQKAYPGEASDALYSTKRQYRTQLGSNAPNSVGGQAKAFNQGMEHAVDLAETLVKLDNSRGLGIPKIAELTNSFRQMTSTQQSAFADKANGIGQVLAGEVGKLFSGQNGGGVHERELTRERFNTVKSPEQLAAALEATMEMMQGGLHALEAGRDRALGPDSGVNFVSKETEQRIARINQIIEQLRHPGAKSAPTTVATSGGLKAGTYNWTPQGVSQ